MEHQRTPLSLNLISPSSPARPVTSPSPLHRQSQSPFRYVQLHQDPVDMNEKIEQTPLSDLHYDQHRGQSATDAERLSREQTRRSYPGSNPPLSSPSHPRITRLNLPVSSPHQSPLVRPPPSLLITNGHRRLPHSQPYTRLRCLRIANLLRSWLPLIMYGLTSLAFLFAISLYRIEVFARLDELSHYLQADERFGHALLFFLIFLTTIPPIPLYSTLIILSGYTFGPWTGAIISYFAALVGALTVFIISRTLLRDTISGWLASTCTIKRVVHAIERRPKLLFLIRLAPYPYNVMNCLLAASPTLTLRTYTVCTALSLFKVIIHTSLGASIHSFKDYHVVEPDEDGNPNIDEESGANTVARMWTIIGIVLCVMIFIYLSIVARKAVDEELDDEPIVIQDSEETIAFLSPRGSGDLEAGDEGDGVLGMAESPFRTHPATFPLRPSASSAAESTGIR